MATGDHKQMPQRVIYAKEIIGVGTQFGPYPGKDAKEMKFSEWMAFVCKAETQQQANLLSFVNDGQKYFRSCKIIQPLETFIVWDKNNDECKSQTDSKEQHNSFETQDVNGGTPIKMNLRKKKSVSCSSEVTKLNNTKPVRSAKEIKTNSEFFEANEVVSVESTSHTKNPANLDDMETDESLFRCSDCSEEFISSAGLAVHRLLHGQDQRCLTCGNKFTPHENLHQHLLSHTPTSYTTCNECFRYFDKEFDLGPCSNKSSKKSLCMECESLVIINREITIAKQITGEMMCNYCGRIYFNKKSLKAHLNKHNSKYCCRKCGKVFGTYNAITRHIVVHTNFKPFKCEMCGMRFTRSSTSQDHIKVCRKRSKRKDTVLQMTNIPINGKKVENTEKNESNVVLNKAYNTRSSSRSKLDSSAIGNEKTDALDCAFGLEDNSSLSSPNGAEFFHCQLENNNIMSNDNTNFPSGSEQHSASQKTVDELNYQHYSSSTHNGQINVTFLPDNDNVIRIESANSNQFISTDISDEIEIICLTDDEDTPFVTNNKNYNNNVMNSSELTSLKINGNTCHDCSVKISSLYNCTECYKVFASIEGLAMHRLVHFCGQTCTKCGNSFTRAREMKEHLLGHSSDDIKNCFKCEIIFGNPFNYHQTLTRETVFSLCNECDVVTSVEAYEKTSSLEIKESGLNECIYDESVCIMKSFQKHETTHLNGISCSECGSCFLSYEELNEHISINVKCQIPNNFSVIKSENEELNKICSELIENASNSNHTKKNDENNLASSNSNDDTSRSSNETINSDNNKLLENSELISTVPMQNEGTVFHYECNECKRNFLTEAGIALHAHLHLDQKCFLCGDHIEWDFDSMFNDDSKNFMLCEKCKSLSK